MLFCSGGATRPFRGIPRRHNSWATPQGMDERSKMEESASTSRHLNVVVRFPALYREWAVAPNRLVIVLAWTILFCGCHTTLINGSARTKKFLINIGIHMRIRHGIEETELPYDQESSSCWCTICFKPPDYNKRYKSFIILALLRHSA